MDNKYLDINGLDHFKNKFERKILDSVAIISSSSGEEIEITDSAEAPLMGLNLYATCKQNTVPGNQLFNSAKMKSGMLDRRTGNISSIAGFVTSDFIPVKPNTQYCLSKVLGANGKFFDDEKQIIDTNWNFQGDSTFTTTENTAYVRFSFASVASSASEIMMNEGKDPLPYERYVGGIPSPNGDYPQEIQTISNFTLEVNDGANAKQELPITIPKQGFYGIPVESGGNYTDTSGQQWISDEIDFTARKLIKRIQKEVFDGSEDENWICDPMVIPDFAVITLSSVSSSNMDNTVLCNRAICPNSAYVLETDFWFRVDQNTYTDINKWKEWLSAHPIEILYPLATPVEYDLSDEEVQAYRSLQTYNDKTVITTNSNLPIWIKSNFILAIRPYVDNKFFELESKMNTVGVVHIINKNELSDNQAYRIAKFDLSKFVETDFGGNYSPDIYIDILSWKYGLFYLKIRPLWATSKTILLYTASFHMKEGDRSIYNASNSGTIIPPFKIGKTNTSIELYYASDMLSVSDTIQILSYNIVPNILISEYDPKDHVVVDWTLQKVNSTSLNLSTFNHYYLGYDSIFSSNDNPNDVQSNGLVPHPTLLQEENGYYLKADGTWDLPKRGNNNFISVVTPSEEMTSQVSSTVGITFVTFDYSKIIESLSLAVNTGSGFEGILIINTKLFGEILINFSVNLFNLAGTVNKNATAYANVGTKSADHNSQISSIQNTYGADIKTPVFIYTDSANNICKIGLYGSASKSPVIIKDCTLNQTYSDFDVNDIAIIWEPTTISISEENTNDAHLFTNMDWSKIFTPIANMTDPDGSYSENNLRRWKLQNNGLVPAPAKYEADQGKVLRADGSWGYQKKPLNDMLAIVSPSDENVEAYNATKETKRISFVTIDFANAMSKVSSGLWSGKLHFDVSENNFGTIHLCLQFILNKTMCNLNIFSTLGTNSVDNNSSAISNLMDYGVETSSPIFVTNEGDGKNIVRIGFNGISAIRSISILDCYVDSPYDITIDDLVISWESSIIDTTLVNKYINSKVISYMDSGEIFSSIYDITSPDMIESTDAKTLKLYKLRNNGFVPAPYQYEADQGYVLCADGTWSSANDIMTSITTKPEDEGKILKAHNGSVIWATLINGEEVGY